MAGWGNLFGKIADQFQGRIERIKNEKEKLLDERQRLISGDCTPASSSRIIVIDTRLCAINQALGSKATD